MSGFAADVAIAVSATVLVLAFAAVARRLLGREFGLARRLIAGVLAFLLSTPLSRAMSGAVPDYRTTKSITPLWFLILAVLCSVLVAMVFLVVAEALVPTGSVPSPVDWVRGLHGRWARTRRYSRIVAIAVRHGLGPYLRGRRGHAVDAAAGRTGLARSLRAALADGGVTFVKLGQVLSTRRDVLPAEFVEELSRLQDRVEPAGWDQVERVLAAELGAPVGEVFAEFDRVPLAAASVAQVHVARLRTGEDVVVKVQRPGIRAVVERDLDILRRIAARLDAGTRWGRAVGMRDLADGFATALTEELDFRVEAGNMVAVAAPGVPDTAVPVRFPAPHHPLCTERVLVMERLSGTPLGAAGGLIAERGLDPAELARTLLELLLRQIMVEGVYHADPHPGNILLLDSGGLGLLDFGSVGRIDAGVREALQRLLLALDRGDPLAATDALLEVVTRPADVDEAGLERALGRFMARHLGAGSVPGVRMFTDLFRIVSAHGLSVPPEVAGAFRALATLEGGLAALAPGFNLVGEARAFGTRRFAELTSPEALRRTALDELTSLVPMLRRLPRRVERIATAAEYGRLGVNVRLFADERDRRVVTGLLHQVLLAFLAATAGVMAVLLLGTEGGPAVTRDVSLYQMFGYHLLVVCGVLALRVLVLIFRRNP